MGSRMIPAGRGGMGMPVVGMETMPMGMSFHIHPMYVVLTAVV